MRVFRSPAVLVVILAVVAGPAHAQAVGKVLIDGTIKLDDGSPLADVDFAATTEPEHGGVTRTKSKKDGRFKIPFAGYGPYTFSATKDGYLMKSISIVVKSPAKEVEFDQKMEFDLKQSMPPVPIGSQRTVTLEVVMAPKSYFELMGISESGAQVDLIGRASGFTQQGKFAESDEILKLYVAEHPSEGPPYYLMGINASESGRKDEAVALLTKAIELSPQQQGPRSILGRLAYDRGDKQSAVDWFTKELEVSPNAVPVAVNRAVVLLELGKKDEAIAGFEKVIALAPTEAGAYLELANLYVDAGQEEKAAEVLSRMERVAKPDPRTWFNIGANYSNQNKEDKAEAAFRKALELEPDFAEALRELGYTLLRKGDFKAATACFERYLKLKPDASDAEPVKAALEVARKNSK